MENCYTKSALHPKPSQLIFTSPCTVISPYDEVCSHGGFYSVADEVRTSIIAMESDNMVLLLEQPTQVCYRLFIFLKGES